jgi:hypothetical protein
MFDATHHRHRGKEQDYAHWSGDGSDHRMPVLIHGHLLEKAIDYSANCHEDGQGDKCREQRWHQLQIDKLNGYAERPRCANFVREGQHVGQYGQR